VLDVVEAIDGGEPAITCAEIRRRSSAGGLPAREYPKPGSIQVLMDRADVAWRAELAATTIGDLALQGGALGVPHGGHQGRDLVPERHEEDKDMNVFIAGATGVLGRVTVPRLVAAGHVVSGTTRSAEKEAQLREQPYRTSDEATTNSVPKHFPA